MTEQPGLEGVALDAVPWTRWVRASARPLSPLTSGGACLLGALSGACLLATELVSSLFDHVDGHCVAIVLGLGTLIGVPVAWASARVQSRRALAACLLLPAPTLGLPVLAWALRRAVELNVRFVMLAGLVAALPAPIAAWRAVMRVCARTERVVPGSRAALAFASAVTAYVFAALLAQAAPGPATLLGTVGLGVVGWLVAASGFTGPVGPWLVASAVVGGLPRLDRAYFPLRTIALGVAFGAAILGARELVALRGGRVSQAVRRSWTLGLALALGWLAVAVASERLVSDHPHAFAAREQPTGTLGATIEALRRVTDFDLDGHAPLFGGRDCAPLDATRSPGAHEIPNNGQDDNCSGGDARGEPAAFLRSALALNPPPPAVRRDAVLVIVDTMRADAVGPNLAAFARDGRRFTHAYATASFTAQSFVGILTGSLPTAVNYEFFSPHDAIVENLPPTVFTAARRAGYTTGVAGGVHGGFSTHFYAEVDVARPLTMIARAEETTDAAIDVWNALDPRQPRFMLVHYLALHSTGGHADYRRTALVIDDELARLWGALGNELVWMVTADHGESFGEYGVFGHSTALRRDQIAVPLVVRYPGVKPGEESAVTSLIGVSPTLIALMAPEQLAEPRGPFFCLGQAGCGDVPAASALEKPATHVHSLIVGRHHAFHGLIADRHFEFNLGDDPDERRPLESPGDVSRTLATWEELAFVRGARVPWFKER